LISALCLVCGFLLFPEEAVNGARNSMRLWALSVVPAMFPYLVMLPVLADPHALRLYRRLFAGVMRKCFRLPGESAAVIVVGMLAGSPAGSMLCASVGGELMGGEIKRTVLPVCGISPGFLVAGVGVGMLGSAGAGYVLAAGQACSQIAMLFLLRALYREDGPKRFAETEPMLPPVRYAVMGVLNVGGYMALFGSVGEIVRRLFGGATGDLLICMLDFPNGASVAAEKGWGLIPIAMLTGFAGICIAAQNTGVLKKVGIRWGEYLAVKFAAASLCAMFAMGILFLCKAGCVEAVMDNLVETALTGVGIVLIFLSVKHITNAKIRRKRSGPAGGCK